MKKLYFLLVVLAISLNAFAQTCPTFTFNGTAPVAPTATAAGIGGKGTIQTYTVPTGVTAIRIDARGAKGGTSPRTEGGFHQGGNGGRVQATYAVTPGDVLYILVAGKGGDGSLDNGINERTTSGGGGATVVSKGPIGTGSLLLVAGGGGGAGHSGGGGISNNLSGSGVGFVGAGGASFLAIGGNSNTGDNCGAGGQALNAGGNGGANTCFKPETNGGGYGGGGAGNYSIPNGSAGGGGGGGYIGGNGGGVAGGNGGSSYADSTRATTIVIGNSTDDNGSVAIAIVASTINLTWTGAVSTDWNNPCNWSPNGIPTATNRLMIPNVANKPVILSATTATCLSIEIGAASSLTINNGGRLTVLPTDDRGTGIFINSKGTLTNNGTLSCTTTGTIDGMALPDSTTFNNNGTATFSTPATDILLGGPNTRVNNSATGIINIQNGSGFRTLTGVARIGTVITNQGTVNYSGGGTAILLNPNYTFNNSGTINITRGNGLYTEGGVLNNLACGKIFISNTTNGLLNAVAGSLVTNAGLIVTNAITNTNGTFNNTGVTNRLPTTGTVTNTGNAAVSVEHNTYPTFAYGGTFNGTINGIFTDSLATISAGTFTAPITFTPLATLPRGVQTLYVKITPSGGACTYVVPFSYNTLTSSVSKTDAPTFVLYQNRPNPFSQQTVIAFDLTETNNAVLTVYDITGRQIFTSNQGFKTGYNEVILNKSVFAHTGTYIYRLTTDKSATVKRLVFIEE